MGNKNQETDLRDVWLARIKFMHASVWLHGGEIVGCAYVSIDYHCPHCQQDIKYHLVQYESEHIACEKCGGMFAPKWA